MLLTKVNTTIVNYSRENVKFFYAFVMLLKFPFFLKAFRIQNVSYLKIQELSN